MKTQTDNATAKPEWSWIASNNSNLIHIEEAGTGNQIATLNAGSKEIRKSRADLIISAVNEFEALKAVADTANKVQDFLLMVKLCKATQAQLEDACELQDKALATLEAVRKNGGAK